MLKELFIVEERIELALMGFQNLSRTYTIEVFRVQATDAMAANTHKLPSLAVVPGDAQPFIQKRRLCSVRSRRLWPHPRTHNHDINLLLERKPMHNRISFSSL